MKSLLVLAGITGFMVQAATSAPAPRFVNFGSLTNSPQIDAIEFINYGSFSILSPVLPYDFQNTLRYTNYGTMNGLLGYRFDNVSDTGRRSRSETFHNDARGEITAGTALFNAGFPAALNFFFGGNVYGNSHLKIGATNVINRGILSIGAEGVLRIEGRNLDLSRGGLEVTGPLGGGVTTLTNFVPDFGIYDEYWGAANDFQMNVVQLDPINLGPNIGFIASPPHNIVFSGFFTAPFCYFSNFIQIATLPGQAFVYTNHVSDTNKIIQAVFVANTDPKVGGDVRFARSPIATNFYRTVAIGFGATETNVVRRSQTINTLFLKDALASYTNFVFLTNLLPVDPSCPTFMPSPYNLRRFPLPEYFGGVEANYDFLVDGLFTTDIFYGNTLSNNVVSNIVYSAYSARITNIPTILPNVQGVTVSNLPGRVELIGDTVNLDRTRIRGEGNVYIKANHLITSTNTVVDGPNLNFIVASTNGMLRVENLARTDTERFAGALSVFSAAWTNQTGMTITNVQVDPNTGALTNVVTTNIVEIGYTVTIVDGNLQTVQPVLVHDFEARSTNVVLSDNMTVVKSFKIDAESFTLEGQLTLADLVQDWDATVAPKLKSFENRGLLNVTNNAVFGTDRITPYQRFANSGTIQAASVLLNASELENSGTIVSYFGPIQIVAGNGRIDGGRFDSITDIDITAEHLKIRSFTVETPSTLNLRAVSSLSDAGITAPNSIQVGDGFALWRKPAFGDLFGTTIRSVASDFALVEHFWAGENRGPTAAGFVNNVVIGRLVLETAFDSLHSFHAVTGNNGLYVEYLDIPGADRGAVENLLSVDPGLVIYFADSNVLPEDLDGALGGRLLWVREFAQGPSTSVDILRADGRTEQMNRALRNSRTIDSDGDGTANFFDPLPLDPDEGSGIALSGVLTSKGVQLSWTAAPQSNYVVEYTTDLEAQAWKPLPDQTSFTVINGRISILDANVVSGTDRQRFYRVRTQP